MKLAKKLSVLSRNTNYLKIDGKKIKYILSRRNVKYPRLEFHGDTLFLIVPKHKKDHKSLIKSKSRWIIAKYDRISKILKECGELTKSFLLFGKKVKVTPLKCGIKIDNTIYAKDFSELKNSLKGILYEKLSKIVANYARKLGVKYGKVYIRHQKTKWSSCSSKRNLTFNLKLISLPEGLINYIVFHEMAHFIEKKHNENFIRIIRKEFIDFKQREEEMTKYWIILNKNFWWNKISNS